MLASFRKAANSRFGLAFFMGFIVLMMLAFASSDISNYFGGFGNASSSETVASVDGDEITADELRRTAGSALDNVRRQNPAATMNQLVASGALDRLLTSLIDSKALLAFGDDHGIIASERLIGSEINKVGAFKGADGQFNQRAFEQALAQQGLTTARFRAEVAATLVSRQLLLPAEYAAVLPPQITDRYAALLKERRVGSIALLPSAAFADKTAPSDAQLNQFYTQNRNTYMRPERRVIRYAMFDETAIKDVPVPSEAEVAKRYEANRAQYAASETRKVTQLILPTEAAAKAVLVEIKGGRTLEASASAKGLGAATLDNLTKQSLSSQSSQAVADATFAASRGAIAGPLRSPLGWHLMRIDTITGKPGKTLEQARPEILAALSEEKRRAAVSDFSAEIQDEFDNGSALGDVAKKLGIEVGQTEQLTADGGVYGKPGIKVNPQLMRVLTTAFGMEQGQNPEIAEITAGKTFILYEVSSIVASAPAPLAEIRDQLATDYSVQEGSKAARAAADRALAAIKQGRSLSEAIGAIRVAGLPPVDTIAMSREALGADPSRVPPPLRLLFRMASGSTKILPAPRGRGFYIVQVKSIEPATIAPDDSFARQVRAAYSQEAGREYAEQLRSAIRSEVGVKRNESAVKALGKLLTGGSN
jgi:peptidyl-prolyl cis-trans isomerase D